LDIGNNAVKGSIVWGGVMITMLTIVLVLAPDVTDFSLNKDGFEFKRPLIKAGEPPMVTPSPKHVPCNIVSLLEIKIEPVKVKPGETVKAQYVICNPDRVSTIVGLGMSIQKYVRMGDKNIDHTEIQEIIDTENDDLVYLVDGIATYERLFKVSEDAEPGIYNIAMAVWEDVPGTPNRLQFGSSGWVPKQLQVIEK